jgi:hypothetical protein
MIARGSFHLLHEITHTPRAAASQAAATNLEVTQSQVTSGDSLFAEQPHGLDANTNTDSNTTAKAAALKTVAIVVCVRSCDFGGTSAINGPQSMGAPTTLRRG